MFAVVKFIYVDHFLQQNQNYSLCKPDYLLYLGFSYLTLTKRFINGYTYEIFSDIGGTNSE